MRIESREEFAAALTSLRERSGRTVRDVARLSGIAASTLGGYFSGRHLPPLKPAGTMARLLAACGVDDPAEVAAWTEALHRVRRIPGPRPAGDPVPYQGLASFQPEDADRFHGREDLTATLLDRIAKDDGPWPLIVVGASGSGKSSLLRAGVVAALRADGVPVRLITPGPDPLDRLGGRTADEILIVDQFEELFTLHDDPAPVVRRLTGRVLIGLRADFYQEALRVPELAAALASGGQVIVAPMSPDGLRRAIVEPARHHRVDVEEGFAELLLRDLAPGEAGSLPLLSHVLLATWELGRGRRLTVADYRASGGLRGAVARTADTLYDSLDPDEQTAARQLFLSLVRVSDTGPDTRRQAPVAEVERAAVLDKFVERRLITVEQDTVGLSHEALLHAWPRLHEWIEADRAGLATARRLAEAAEIWDREERDPAALYQGARLAAARDLLAAGGHPGTGPLAAEFVRAGLKRERGRTVRLYQSLALLLVLLIVAVVAGVVAVQQRQTAETERNLAISRLVATRADRVRETDPALAAQLSLAAQRIGDTAEARASLIDASASVPVTRMLGGAGVMQSVSHHAGRNLVAAGNADTTVRLWDLADPSSPRAVATLPGGGDVVYSTALSPSGTLLAAGNGDGTVRVWDIADPVAPREVATLTGPEALVYTVAFSPDGRTLAAGSGDRSVRLYDTATWRPGPSATGLPDLVQAVTFRPDGAEIAAGLADGTVRLFRSADLTVEKRALTGPDRKVFAVAYSPDGQVIAAGSGDHHVYRWKTDGSPAGTPLSGVDSWVNSVAFGGDLLAFASSDGTAQVWDLTRDVVIARLPHPGPVTGVTFAGDRLLTSAADGVVRAWRIPGPILTGLPAVINGVAFSPDDGLLAVAGGDVTIFDVRARSRTGAPLPARGAAAGAVGFSPDGRVLAVGHGDGTIELYDPSTRKPYGPPVPGHGLLVESLAFSPDGRVLATAGDDNTVRLWDVSDPSNPVQRSTAVTFRAYAYVVRFSPDGTLLAAGSVDKTARIVDVRDPGNPVTLGGELRGPDHYVMSLAFHPNSRILAMGNGDHTARLYDLTDPAAPRRVGPVLEGPANYVYALAFTPDGGTLAAAVTDGTLWFWNTRAPARPALISTQVVPSKALYTVAFAADGRTVAAAGREATVWLWNTDPTTVATDICATTGDPLTRAEWTRYVPSLPYQPPC
ncbi:helix-turn-helix domain-containing protein [Actinoplanes sp. G11-F43]|uniref:nSTAND1 domain-containing NTPase n=1 Tax=Actinoplanes sp. G11-F43 TaxID=3424130 RepID=UPI003D336102